MNAQYNSQQFEQVKEQSAKVLSETLGAFIAILKAPVSAGRQIAGMGSMKLGIGLFSIQAIISGILAMIFCGQINDLLYSLTSAVGSFVDGPDEIKMNIFTCFLLTVIGSLAISFALALVLFLLVKIFKANTTYAHMVSVVGVRSVGTTSIIVLAILLYFIKEPLGIAVYVFSGILGLLFMVRVIPSASSLSEDRVAYVTILATVLGIVIFYVVMRILLPLYVPDEFIEFLDGIIEVLENPLSLLDSFYM